jgi:hypothetical protein
MQHLPNSPDLSPLQVGCIDESAFKYCWRNLNAVHHMLSKNERAAEELPSKIKESGLGAKAILQFCNGMTLATKGQKLKYGISGFDDVVPGYAKHLSALLELEQYRCARDMHRYDLYSIRWNQIEIPPPPTADASCPDCHPTSANGVVQHKRCAYHLAMRYAEISGMEVKRNKPIRITSADQLQTLPAVLRAMKKCKCSLQELSSSLRHPTRSGLILSLLFGRSFSS